MSRVHFPKKNIRCVELQDNLLKTGNKTANIKCKKLQFINILNGDGSKTVKSQKGNVNHDNIDIH